MTELHPFKWRHFEAEIILLCVRWYLRYGLSYRDLEEIMRERRLAIDHTTIYRWVQVHRRIVRSDHLNSVEGRRSSVLDILLQVFATQP